MRLAGIREERRRAARKLDEANDAVAFLEDDLREAKDRAKVLEKRTERLKEEEESWPSEPDEVRCVCGEDLTVRKSCPRSVVYPELLVFDPPPGTEGPGGAERCPTCGMEADALVNLLSRGASPTREQLARSRELQPALLTAPGAAPNGAVASPPAGTA